MALLTAHKTLRDCIMDLHRWCSTKRLQLNADKTEILWFGTTTNLDRLRVKNKRIVIGSTVIEPSNVVQSMVERLCNFTSAFGCFF